MFWALFGYTSVLEMIVPFDSDEFAVRSRRNRVEVTKFSTWGERRRYDSHMIFQKKKVQYICVRYLQCAPNLQLFLYRLVIC
jgi:hypothetical protein